MKTKTSEVLAHLKDNGSITSMEAIELYGATRLSAIVFRLRKKGYEIDTVTVGTVDRYGHAVNYGKYVYRGEEDADRETLGDAKLADVRDTADSEAS